MRLANSGNGDETMRRLKKIQLSLLCTAALAAVLCLCAPADKLPALSAAVYVLFGLLPLLAATGLQLLAVRKDLAVLSHYIYIYRRVLKAPQGEKEAYPVFCHPQ